MCLGGRLSSRSGNRSTQNYVIPLVGAFAFVKVMDFTAEVTIRQRYENQEKDPIEAVYEFPLDPRASICEFYAEIDERNIVGTLKEKDASRDIYDNAIASGHGAYLLEGSDLQPNLFTANVGNLPAGKEVLLVIVYITELEFDEGKLKLVLPANPFPPDGVRTANFSLPSRNKTPYSELVPYGLNIKIQLDMPSQIMSVASHTHPIQFSFEEEINKATITLADHKAGAPLGANFELFVSLKEPHRPTIMLQEGEDKKVAMLSFYPELLDNSQMMTEMIFLVDRSGSMSGTGINQVKDTLQIFLRSLPEGTFFNIVGFGSSFEKLFPQSVEYNQSSLQVASNHVENMSADMGGTNILDPLKNILGEKPKEGFPRQVFMLTDGAVYEPNVCLDLVRRHANTTRIFTFGLGSDVDETWVLDMAKKGEGRAELIQEGESMSEKVLKQLNRALKPAFTDLMLDWGCSQLQQAPYYLPPLFAGNRLISYAFLPKEVSIETVTLKAKIGQQNFSFEFNQSMTRHVTGSNYIHKLASRALIQDLEESRSCFHTLEGNLIDKTVNVKNMIIKLSIQSGILSKYTSFVAVEKRDSSVIGNMQLRKITANNQRDHGGFRGGRGGVRGGSRGGRGGGGRGGSRGAITDVSFQRNREEDGLQIRKKTREDLLQQRRSLKQEKEDIEEKSTSPSIHSLTDVIKFQNANGSFPKEVVKALLPKVNLLEELKNKNIETNGKEGILCTILITAIVCEYIAIKFKDQKTSWNLIVTKSQSWIKKQTEQLQISVDMNELGRMIVTKYKSI